MAEPPSQNFANHNRLDPLFHFFLLPIMITLWIVSVISLVRHPGWWNLWQLLLVTALAVTAVKTRMYAVKVQDRVIRLEQRIRLAALLPESLRSQMIKLSEGQLIALRFAADEEVPALAQRALSENLSRADIKKSIKNWQPDNWRV
jgi:Family of unknown function (DUF6526)